MTVPRVSVQGLSKAFRRQHATRSKGLSMEGPTALRHLLRQTFGSSARTEKPARGDRRYLWALDDVSFDVPAGRVLGIIGRNGAGKSTLLKILARVMHPTSGRVTINGRVVSMLELGVGFAPELSVRQNIHIQGRLAGIHPREIRAAEDGILAFADLVAQADAPLVACPSGASVQLSFAAMIGFGADIILADEVLAVGDSRFRHACEERVRAAGESGESVLFVSHDMAAIRRICTSVMWIDRGRIVQAGDTNDVVNAYTAELLAGRLLPPLTSEGLASSCALLDVRLLDGDREQVGALQLTEPGYIDCLFRSTRPDVAASVELELWCGKHHVFSTTSPPISAPAPTTFRAGIRIPAHFLNELQYEARIRLHLKDLSGAATPPVVAAEERLGIVVMNPHPHESVWSDWTWNRDGLISPRLTWRLAR